MKKSFIAILVILTTQSLFSMQPQAPIVPIVKASREGNAQEVARLIGTGVSVEQ